MSAASKFKKGDKIVPNERMDGGSFSDKPYTVVYVFSKVYPSYTEWFVQIDLNEHRAVSPYGPDLQSYFQYRWDLVKRKTSKFAEWIKER